MSKQRLNLLRSCRVADGGLLSFEHVEQFTVASSHKLRLPHESPAVGSCGHVELIDSWAVGTPPSFDQCSKLGMKSLNFLTLFFLQAPPSQFLVVAS